MEGASVKELLGRFFCSLGIYLLADEMGIIVLIQHLITGGK